jgi:hypothetical protein
MKKKAGRKPQGQETKKLFAVRLEPSIAKKVQELGEGSFTKGIDKLIKLKWGDTRLL